MVLLLEKLFSVIWHEEVEPRQWREGITVIPDIIVLLNINDFT